MPNIGREILDLITIPDFQHPVEPQMEQLYLKHLSRVGLNPDPKNTDWNFSIKKEMVVRMDELKKPGPKVHFPNEPFIDYYQKNKFFLVK